MATQNLGRVKIVWKGDYSSSTAYVVDDAVFYEGSSYICKQNATAKIPTNTNYWDKMASRGNSGAVPAIGMSATVDGTSSATPSVTVTEGGTALQPTFELAFSGLKGAKGDKGDKGDSTTANEDNIIANTKLIKDTVGWSGKNKLKNTSQSGSSLGITQIVNADYTMDVYGLATETKFIDIGDSRKYLKLEAGKKYRLSGCPSGGTPNTYKLDIRTDISGQTTVLAEDTGNGAEFTMPTIPSGNNNYCHVVMRIANGTNMGTQSSPKVFKPMITDADILDQSYEPYRDTTAFPRDEQAVLGAVNLLDNKAPTATENGITYTVNADKSETISGSATAESRTRIWPNLGSFLDQYKGKTLYLSAGLPSDAPNDYFLNLVQKQGNTDLSSVNVVGGEIPFTVDSRTDNLYIAFIVKNGTNLSTPITIKPQIILAPNTPYAPYAMTNKELTDKMHHLVHRVVYKSSDEGRSDLTIAADGVADINIPIITGYRILTTNVTISGTGSSAYSYVSGAGGTNARRIVNRGSQSYTWGYEVEVYYIATDEID